MLKTTLFYNCYRRDRTLTQDVIWTSIQLKNLNNQPFSCDPSFSRLWFCDQENCLLCINLSSQFQEIIFPVIEDYLNYYG